MAPAVEARPKSSVHPVLYEAHGLTIASPQPIPELALADPRSAPEVFVSFGTRPAIVSDDRSDWFESTDRARDGRPELVATRRDRGRWLEFAYADGTTFDVDAAGCSICVTFPPQLPFAGVCEYLIGPILGVVMRLRGIVCLHASAVVINGRAFAFMGPAGAGKSTLAAMFARSGFGVLSDDTIALMCVDSTWKVSSGYPRVRLWPDAAAALDISSASTAFVASDDEGTRHQLDLRAANAFARASVPLACIYLMEFGDATLAARIDAVDPAQALPIVSANTFASRVLDYRLREQEFHTLANLLEKVPVRRLTRLYDLAALPSLRDAIVADAV
jgi:hypothetical protein